MPDKKKIQIIHAQLATLEKQRNYPVEKEEKEALVRLFTRQRESSTKGLTDAEADKVIDYLRGMCANQDKHPPGNLMRRHIIAMAHEMKWETQDGKADMKRINGWCVHYGFGKKPLNDYEYDELPQLVTQFKNVYNSFLNGI
jgi:hypothetical protein